MKILFNHSVPFFLAHGGVQVQIEQTRAALQSMGVDVEFLNWWDETQTGDIIHSFGRPAPKFIEQARAKGFKFVFTDLLTAQGSRSASTREAHRLALRIGERLLPARFTAGMSSRAYQVADACVALTPWEASLMQDVYGAPRQKIHIVPNGVEEVFLKSPATSRGIWLVCTATITGHKRIVELATAAVEAKTPVWIIGSPYFESDAYYRAFKQVAAANPDFVRYEGAIGDREQLAGIYRAARGFVLLSTMESLSLSALEAAACECPLLLTDLPWARSTFGEKASYCPLTSKSEITASRLREFHDAAPGLPIPAKPLSWSVVARQLKSIYDRLPDTSR